MDKKCYLVLSKCNVFAFIYEHVGVALRRNKSLQSFPDYCLWTRMKNEFSCSNFRSFLLIRILTVYETSFLRVPLERFDRIHSILPGTHRSVLCPFYSYGICLESPFANRVLPLCYGDDHDGSLVVDTIPSFDSSQCDNQSFPFHCRVVIDKMWIETVDYLKMATPEIKTLEH